MTALGLTSEDGAKVEEFAGSLFMACLAAMELANVELGVRLGLYETLAGAGPLTAGRPAPWAGGRSRRPTWPLAQESPNGTRRSGSSNRPSRACSRWTIPRSPPVSDDSIC